jgi:hypothetical protein
LQDEVDRLKKKYNMLHDLVMRLLTEHGGDIKFKHFVEWFKYPKYAKEE